MAIKAKIIKDKMNLQATEIIIFFIFSAVLLTLFFYVFKSLYNQLYKYGSFKVDVLHNEHRIPNSDEFDYLSLKDYTSNSSYSLNNLEKSFKSKDKSYNKFLDKSLKFRKEKGIETKLETKVEKEAIGDDDSEYKYSKKTSGKHFFSMIANAINKLIK